MDLEEHSGLESLIAELLIDQDHRPFDQIGGRALNDGVDRSAFGEVSISAGGRHDAVDRPATAQDRLNAARGQGVLECPGDEPVDTDVFLEIGVDECGRFGLGDSQACGQAKGESP